jgi:membrane fusion protein (multidrug efflux system)
MKSSRILATMAAVMCLSLPACNTHEEQPEVEHHKIVLTSPKIKDVIVTQPYV